MLLYIYLFCYFIYHLCLILVSLVILYNTDLDKRTHMFYLYFLFYFIYFLGCFNVVNTTEQSFVLWILVSK